MELIGDIFKQLKAGWYAFNRLSNEFKIIQNWEKKETQEKYTLKELADILNIKNTSNLQSQLYSCRKNYPIINHLLLAEDNAYILNGCTDINDHNTVIGTLIPAKGIYMQISELNSAKEKAQYSDYVKSAFLANMAHDIRVPLNSISGFSEMLTDDDFTLDEKREFASIIERNTDKLVNMVSDIIDVSKIEAGQIELIRSIFNPENVLLELFSKHQNTLERSNKREVSLKIKVPSSNETIYLNTDKLRFRQVLDQLLDNAIKFTHMGSITFGYKYSNTSNIEIFVEDTGIGIPEEKRNGVFNLFKKDEEIYTKPYGSNGLGLHIAKNITKLIGTELTFETATGKGTNFSFKLPVFNRIVTEIPTFSRNNKSRLKGSWNSKKILVVDDIKEIFEYIRLTLRSSYITCLYAPSGEAALKIIETISDIDLVLMDIQMPDMNGVSTLKQLTKHKFNRPVIALTAFALTGDKEKFLSDGFSDYLSKPLKQTDLYQKLKTYLGPVVKQ